MKLDSVPPYPINVIANGIPTNLVRNMTHTGEYQIARVLKPGGPKEGEFEILFSGTQEPGEEFLRQQVEKDFPGLVPGLG